MTRPARRIEIEKLRIEGYEAAESGKNINNNPYSMNKDGMNVIHWVDGFHSYEPPKPEIEIPICVPLCNVNHDWYCGCGHWNGSNLSVCARCGRTPSETPQ